MNIIQAIPQQYHKMLLKVPSILNRSQRRITALYVSHDKLKNNYRLLRPANDYKQLASYKEIEKNIQRRCLLIDTDAKVLFKHWISLKGEEKKRGNTIDRVNHWASKIESEQNGDKDENKLDEYHEKSKKAAQDLCDGDHRIAEIEIILNKGYLSLPNHILHSTPDNDHIHFEYGKRPDADSQHHLEYLNLIDYRNKAMVYQMGDAAKFDLQLPFHAMNYFRKNGYSTFSNPDFVRTALIEAATCPLDNVYEVDEQLHEDCTNRIHLAGKGSPLSYLGSMAINQVKKDDLPLKCVSTGKIYKRQNENDFGLYQAEQSTGVSISILNTKQNIENELHTAIDLISNLYKSLDVHFRVVYLSPKQLQPAECFAVRYEMYSPHFKQYLEVGRLGHFSDFLCKRLQFKLEDTKKKMIAVRPHVLAGNILNVTNIIGIMLETNGSVHCADVH